MIIFFILNNNIKIIISCWFQQGHCSRNLAPSKSERFNKSIFFILETRKVHRIKRCVQQTLSCKVKPATLTVRIENTIPPRMHSEGSTSKMSSMHTYINSRNCWVPKLAAWELELNIQVSFRREGGERGDGEEGQREERG